VAAYFDDATLVDDDNAIGPLGCREAVGNQDCRTTFEHSVERSFNNRFTP
jgi:hypothetical protein